MSESTEVAAPPPPPDDAASTPEVDLELDDENENWMQTVRKAAKARAAVGRKDAPPAVEPAPDPKAHAVPSQDDDHELAALLAEAERVIGPA